mgnify:CR=1 FL=1
MNRIKVRVLNGGHDIPHDDIVRRFYRSKKIFGIYKDLVDDEYRFVCKMILYYTVFKKDKLRSTYYAIASSK